MNDTESKGSLIGSIIVVIILIAGAAYLFTNRDAVTNPTDTATTTATTTDTAAAELEVVSSSDELRDIETDAAATNLNNLDQESAAIEAELNLE